MTSDGGKPPKPKESAQGTLLGFPQSPKEPAPAEPAPPAPPAPAATIHGAPPVASPLPKPSSSGSRHPLPPPRGRRESAPMPAARASQPHPAQAAPPAQPAAVEPPPAAPPPAARAPKPAAVIVDPPASAPAPLPGQRAAPSPSTAPPVAGGPTAPARSPASGPSAVPQPYAASATSPHGPHSGPTGPHSGPSDPHSGPATLPETAAPTSGPAPDPYHSGPVGGPPRLESHPDGGPREWGVGAIITENPGSKFVSFLKISAKRAFRLRIEPDEVLPEEREALERASPPIVDRNLQAFLAWRRSVLFLVAVALVPLMLFGFGDALLVGQATPIRVIKMAPVLAEGVFLAICWMQLRNWAHWRKQNRWLLIGWLLFVATPFIVFLYPLRSVFESSMPTMEDYRAFNLDKIKANVLPFSIAMTAMLQLAPKAISLMPGLVRASLVIKLLFPGSTAPGWLIVVAAPLYALLAYVILIVPYQFTGSGWFIFGVLGVVAGQALLARAGFALAQPLTEDEALVAIKRVRSIYVTIMIVSAVLIVIALSSLVVQLHLPWTDVVLSVLKFETNVLILTLIGSDLVIKHLDQARLKTVGRDHVEELAELKIAAFVSLDAPHVPPPPGPAPDTDLWNKP